MTNANEKITQYFSKVTIRTMKKDLENLRSGGGLISYNLEQVEPTTIPENITPPEVSVPDILTPEAPNVDTIQQPLSSASSEKATAKESSFLWTKKTQAPKISQIPETKTQTDQKKDTAKDSTNTILYVLVGVLVVVLVGSASYWLVYPRLAAVLQSPSSPATPSPTTIEQLPSPTPENYLITFPEEQVQLKSLNLLSNKQEDFIELFTQDILAPVTATPTIQVYELTQQETKRLSGPEVAKLFAPNALASFIASIDTQYAVFSYLSNKTTPYVGIVLSLRPETIKVTKSIMTNWETAKIEEYFVPLYSPYEKERNIKREESAFTTINIQDAPFRKIKLQNTAADLEFVYGFYKNYLIISSHTDAVRAIISYL